MQKKIFCFILIASLLFLFLQITPPVLAAGPAIPPEDPTIDISTQTQCKFQVNQPIAINKITNIQPARYAPQSPGAYGWWWDGDGPPVKILPIDQQYNANDQTLSITIPASDNTRWGDRTFCINKIPSMASHSYNCIPLKITQNEPTGDTSCKELLKPTTAVPTQQVSTGQNKIPGLQDIFKCNPVNPQGCPNPIQRAPGATNFATLGDFFSGLLNIIFYAAAFVAFFYILWGTFSYITAQGKKEDLAKARARITWAIIGLVIVFLAFIFTKFIAEVFKPKGGLPF